MTLGQSFTLTASASDSDGTVTKVDYYATGSRSERPPSPYTLVWTPGATGSYSLTAIATDNSLATTTSAPVSVTVNPVVTGTTVVLQRGLNGYAGVSDTYLDNYCAPPCAAVSPHCSWIRSITTRCSASRSSRRRAARCPTARRFCRPRSRSTSSIQRHVAAQRAAQAVGREPGDMDDHPDRRAVDRWRRRRRRHRLQHATDALVTPDWNPGWVTFDVTPRVQQWSSSGATTAGAWRRQTAAATRRQFTSSEYTTDTTLRPTLTVVYSGGSSNVPPTVGITTPTAGAAVTLGQSFTLTASANDTDGTVTKVDYYADGVPIGTAIRHRIRWSGLRAPPAAIRSPPSPPTTASPRRRPLRSA